MIEDESKTLGMPRGDGVDQDDDVFVIVSKEAIRKLHAAYNDHIHEYGKAEMRPSREVATRVQDALDRARRQLASEVVGFLDAASHRQNQAALTGPVPKGTMGLWRMHGIRGGKYLVQRRDGTVPEWPYFVLGARDPAAPPALRAYAEACGSAVDATYREDVLMLAAEFERYRAAHGAGDPDATPHRPDHAATVAKMTSGKGA